MSSNQEGDDPNESYFRVMMSNGQNVDIMTQAGADAFLTGQGDASAFIRVNLTQVEQARERLQQPGLDTARKRQLQEDMVRNYVMFGYIAHCATPKVFEDKATTEDLEALLDHAHGVFSELTEAETWKRTGVLATHDQELFECLISFNKHLRFTKLMFSPKDDSSQPLVNVLAKFCAARSKPNMFGAPVAETLLSIVNNIQVSLQIGGWETNKVFKNLEAAGLLAQVFRAITVPPTYPEDLPKSLQLLDFLHRCEKVIRKKLQPGTPTGDVLEDILQGRDGHLPVSRRNQEVMVRLQNLRATSDMSNRKPVVPEGSDAYFCRTCNKSALDLGPGRKLSCCAKCKNTYYCCRDCQVADWKSHKRTCQSGVSSTKGHQGMVFSFVQENYYEIMTELGKQMRQRNLPKREFYVEINFFKDLGQASAPAEEKKFKIVVTKEALEGSRPAEPDWFYRGTEVYEKNVSRFLEGAKDHYKRLTTDHLLCIVRFPEDMPGVYRLQLFSPETQKSIVSDDALDAFMGNDFAAMQRILGSQSEYVRFRRSQEMRQRLEERGLVNDDFMSHMARLAQRSRDFMESDEWRHIQDEVGSDEEEDD